MSTFPILYLYNPKNKRNKRVISNEICSSYEERQPQAINSFFLRGPHNHDYMWIATAKIGDRYNWSLHRLLEQFFKKLEVYNVTNDL